MIDGSPARFSGEGRVKFRLDIGGEFKQHASELLNVVPPHRVRLVSMGSESDGTRWFVRG